MAEILYADDDELMREIVTATLEGAGHTVRVVEDGTRALAELRRSAPDLVLLDYRMGDPDGFVVCRRIKDNPALGHLPVLILTGEGEIDDRLEGFEAGADDYLAKPVHPRELIARVRALLELARRGLDRNPTSGLPGGQAIRDALEDRWSRAGGFAVCYLDLDHFKPFGERFGFVVSDPVVREVGELLREATEEEPDAFAGHVGGDDFVLICRGERARDSVARLRSLFRERLLRHLPEEVVREGRYLGRDRSGEEREFPLTALSAAILHVDPAHPVSLRELGEAASVVKERAKRSGESGVVEADFPLRDAE